MAVTDLPCPQCKHPLVGKACRVFVPRLDDQRDVMTECTQNHRPDTMVIDEIGRKSEANAARTAASRGVCLVATAHESLRSLLRNPKLNQLLGGVAGVALSD